MIIKWHTGQGKHTFPTTGIHSAIIIGDSFAAWDGTGVAIKKKQLIGGVLKNEHNNTI